MFIPKNYLVSNLILINTRRMNNEKQNLKKYGQYIAYK